MKDVYESPFNSRYASAEMQALFSPDFKFQTWRKLWIALAESEKELGLGITGEQIAELKAHERDIDYETAEQREKQVRHDVMAHVFAYGEQCPKAKPIIHLGATSCYVGDNTDIIIMNEALKLILKKLVNLADALSRFALPYITITPTFSICDVHGYLAGEHETCPRCAAAGETRACEIWTRVMGYYRPKSAFNIGKQGEYEERICFAEPQ